ncbi:MAG: ATP-grasp domain-containing protein [Caulobacteraceae bacterium]|nr:ATP-grasp domain-containing protein [Caulobacteraceae bacterium]
MIESLLIANRGEIARRIIRTARRMGVRTVSVYSDADGAAPHVREANAAVRLGPAPARDSYLRGDLILEAAQATGARAIHPGYGFLSENADFAEQVIAAGRVWVGPPPKAIRAMGLKDAAKALMAAAGVPVTPGYLGEDQSAERLAREAATIGYPVLIKAVAGGGGKGMRKVEQASDFPAALESCRREAAASFGDDRVLLETYVARPRHIEVQVFADTHGRVVHLFERDCSVQRRHQKVIEEAPAPGMTEAARAAICEAAVQAARAVDYVGAGTVEFIADGSAGLQADRIWFMEMNTRLQVEHPVTEAVTGLDLVEWQLRVAAGEPLPLAQSQISLRGHAIEARLYAEAPSSDFLPSIGPLTHLRLPQSVRVDSGVEAGGEVGPHYDPMIAKLIAHRETRDEAARALARACRQTEVWPVRTNAGFLARVIDHPDFLAAALDTSFIDTRREALIPTEGPPATAWAAAARSRMTHEGHAEDADPWRVLAGFRMGAAPDLGVLLQSGDEVRRVPAGAGLPGLRDGFDHIVFLDGEAYSFSAPKAVASQASGSDGRLIAPMPGKVTALHTAKGAKAAKGAPILTLEAMKMEHTLYAPFDAVVVNLGTAAGDQVSEGQVLARLEPSAS